MLGFKVCVSTLYDVRTMTKSPNNAFLRTYPRQATLDCIYSHTYLLHGEEFFLRK
jgi:hypothetical protein